MRCSTDGGKVEMCSDLGHFEVYRTCAESCSLVDATPQCTVSEASYVGSSYCEVCHNTDPLYTSFLDTGHHSALNKIEGNNAPALDDGALQPPPPGMSWSDISYRVGAGKWRALFADTTGNVITGDEANPAVQYISETESWTGYHTGEKTSMDCGGCHSTGYDAQGASPAGLPGIVGSWSEAGVQCESCHGPGSKHVASRDPKDIQRNTSPALCGQCHSRTDGTEVLAADGFLLDTAQFDEFSVSPHNTTAPTGGAMTCISCHDPHSTVKDGKVEGTIGLTAQCRDCHSESKLPMNISMNGITCIDCHMPPVVKSAVTKGPYEADLRSHLFKIDTDPNAEMFSKDGKTATGVLTLDYVCLRCHQDKDKDWAAKTASAIHATPPGTDSYVGDDTCQACHADNYNSYLKSGHPNMLGKVENGKPPTLPYSVIPKPPTGLTWNDISYVVGGYGWKANFLDKKGYLVTGDTSTYVLATNSWGPNHQSLYDCARCHTTGYDANGPAQDGLEGVKGSWVQPGVHCEACHGPGSEHAATGRTDLIEKNTQSSACGQCHTQGNSGNAIAAAEGFIKNESQYDEWLVSPHGKSDPPVDCVSCHNPHRSTKYEGVDVNELCSSCHEQIEVKGKMGQLLDAGYMTCADCHMAPAVKSAVQYGPYEGDMSSHLFNINTQEDAQMFSGDYANGYLTLEYSCLYCHTDQDMKWASDNAGGIHQ